MTDTIRIEREEAVVTVSLNRPGSHNALNPRMTEELTEAFLNLALDETARVIVLTGRGRSFCAGADLASMREAADSTHSQNVADGQAIFDLMWAVDSCPKPVVGRINGAAIGGGAGLVSCCDIAVAAERATFAFSEARLGLIPAVISPFVLAKIGSTAARQLFLTGERFKASLAKEIGLVQYVVSETDLDAKVAERIEQLLQAAPGAQAAAKGLIHHVASATKAEARAFTGNLFAQRRASPEGREGMSAFLAKRRPSWQPSKGDE